MGTDLGLIGLGVMGRNLALNMISHGFTVSAFDPWPEAAAGFFEGPARGREGLFRASTMGEFIGSLAHPRRIMLMVKAGQPVDCLLEQLVPALEPGDILIDGGNSCFRETRRRCSDLQAHGLLYLGVGVSGGEEGALNGPSIMAGGHEAAWREMAPLFAAISARADDGAPCCGFQGPDGAGHFTKMVHNGIEYADMQLIGEAYFLMREMLGLEADDMKAIFTEWNAGELNSYLIEITAHILGKKDPETGKAMVDVILDRTGQKGTGRWTVQEALELGVAVPTIAEAVFARNTSMIKEERVAASLRLSGPLNAPADAGDHLIEDIRAALYASKICAYAQGFDLLRQASETYGWGMRLGETALIWRGGCIIRARFLNRIREAYERQPDLRNLMLDPFFARIIQKSQESWRRVVSLGAGCGIPLPAFSASLLYFDSYRRELLPANLLQAQRDYFGAHTYERVDRPGAFHGDWHAPGGEVPSLSMHKPEK